jgi:drug/metabolite transporter (DMT)-like permease
MARPERFGSAAAPAAGPAGRAGGAVALALAVVYLVWGSTYLAIRFAIETLPPFSMAGLRFLIAGGLLYGFARLAGAPPPARRHLLPSLVIGALLLLGGNGGVVWAQHHVPSGVAALLVAVEPVWIALLAPLLLGHRRAGAKALVGLVAGVAGVGVLVLDPRGLDPTSIDPWGALAIVLAALSWAAGSLWSVRAPQPASRAQASGLQMLFGGALLSMVGGASGEWSRLGEVEASTRSVVAFLYLVVFGSIVAFSAYAYLLRAARPTVAATYAFVNPIVAVLLGWLLAGEALSWRVGVASALILAAVALLITDGAHGEPREAAPVPADVEPEAVLPPPLASRLERRAS